MAPARASRSAASSCAFQPAFSSRSASAKGSGSQERTRRAEIVETNTTQRALIGAQRDVVLAYIAAYGGRAGTLAGERGVFLDASGEFVPWHVAQQELDAARRLTG